MQRRRNYKLKLFEQKKSIEIKGLDVTESLFVQNTILALNLS